MESVHYLIKTVAGVPLRRPAWFFDIHQQGEGLTDVGTHLVDLVPWILLPDQSIDYRRDIEVLVAERRPTVVNRAQFCHVAGEAGFPEFLRSEIQRDGLHYFCNTLVSYRLRGIHTTLNILWDVEAETGAGDTHFAVFRGSQSRVEVRQGREQCFKPEVYVEPNDPAQRVAVLRAVKLKIAALQPRYWGLGVEEVGERLWVTIPDNYRIGHEAHFAEVTNQFLRYLRNPKSLPAWEKPNMLAKYFLTTQGVRIARQSNS
jgi:predicted dehydrogenase